jgi:hypothetical protein
MANPFVHVELHTTDAIRLFSSGFFEIKVGLVVCPSTYPTNSFTRRVSAGSPPSTKIFVFDLRPGTFMPASCPPKQALTVQFPTDWTTPQACLSYHVPSRLPFYRVKAKMCDGAAQPDRSGCAACPSVQVRVLASSPLLPSSVMLPTAGSVSVAAP